MKRRPGAGSIEQLPSGRYRARVVLADGERHELGTHASRDEAEGVIAAAIELAAAAKLEPVGGVTLRGFGTRYLDDLETSGSYVGMAGARSMWRRWLCETPFIDWPLRRVTPRAVRSWIRSVAKRPDISDSWCSQLLVMLRKVLGAAVEAELIEENPALHVRVPRRPSRTDDAWTYLTPDEQASLVSCDDIPERWRLTFAVAIGTGMRWGELVSLRLSDVDLERGRITVRYGKPHGGTKGRRVRHLPIFPDVAAALRRWIQLLPGFCPRNANGLVFPGELGGFQKVSRIPGWRDYLLAAGIVRRVRPHDLRHTCATSLISGWWGPPWRLEDVSAFLGHASLSETERYAHLAPSAVTEAAARVSPVMSTLIPRGPKTSANSVIGVSDGSSAQPEQSRTLGQQFGHSVASSLARRLLERVAAGEQPGDLAESLASEVLSWPEVALARAILAGGPHALDRALELAERLVGDVAAKGSARESRG